MNKLFAALMTLMILGTVAVVFFLGIMSLGGLPENTMPEAEQTISEKHANLRHRFHRLAISDLRRTNAVAL